MDLKKRKVEMFRCHLDPMVGVKAKNAFMVGQDGVQDAELSPIGVWVRWVNTSPGNDKNAIEHVVPYSNIQSIRLARVPVEEPKPE